MLTTAIKLPLEGYGSYNILINAYEYEDIEVRW
jgi:hypothetical protein